MMDSSANRTESRSNVSLLLGRQDFGKCILAVCIFGVILVWCFVRSYYVNEGSEGLSDDVVPLAIRIVVMFALVVPAIIAAIRGFEIAWLAGMSGAIGAVPLLPLLPFLREYTHIVVLLWALILTALLFRRIEQRRVPVFAKLFALYILVSAVSAVVNFIMFHNIWQIKVGITFLILFGAFAALIIAVAAEPSRAERRFDLLLDGFVLGVFGQAVIALVAIPLIVYFPFSVGNDTVFGLAYYDKYKSSFSGPVSLGMFFVISVPLILLWMHRRGSTFRLATAYFQLMPWFMMATGSRTARIIAIGSAVLLLLTARTRRAIALIMPSAILAYWVGFNYQSLPAGIFSAFKFLGREVDPSRDLSDRFFTVTDRIDFIKDTVREIHEAPFLTKLFGFGPGVGGYRVSGFPAPHNMVMNQWAETGVVGLLALGGFIAVLAWGLFRHARAQQPEALSAWLLLIAMGAFAVVNATYNPMYWGYTMILLLLSVSAVTAFDENEARRLAAG